MPDVNIAQFIPTAPLHWLTICHYLLLLTSILIFANSDQEAPMMFMLSVAALMLSVAVHLYIDFLQMGTVGIFFLKTGIFVLPIMLAGLAPSSSARGLAVLAAVFGFCILVMGLGIGCIVPQFADPRSLLLCM